MNDKESMKPKKQRRYVSQVQFIAAGFMLLILTGTILLMLPFSSRDGQAGSLLNCLFTATSASCVTGLVVYDTWSHWSLFGQIVILIMIQIGGLGFVTIGIFLSIFLRRRISLRERGLLQESVNTFQIGGIIRLAQKILIGTCIFEGAGALLLAIRFLPRFGVARGIWYSIFHSVSAFCNAGFDLMGCEEAYISLVPFAADWLVNLVLITLIVVGGIGFVVWDDLTNCRFKLRRVRLHTKLVLVTTVVLIFGGAALIYLFERSNVLADMTLPQRLLASLFASVTARTAGFNTVDTGAMTDAGKFLTILLMLVGGSPGSTAGGVKTTTVAVLYLYLIATVQRTRGVNAFGRRLEEDAIKRASAFFLINFSLGAAGALLLMGMQQIPMSDALFETFSAIGTVGMTTGITRALNSVSRAALIFLMYCGRVGSLSFALALTNSREKEHLKLPEEKITIG